MINLLHKLDRVWCAADERAIKRNQSGRLEASPMDE